MSGKGEEVSKKRKRPCGTSDNISVGESNPPDEIITLTTKGFADQSMKHLYNAYKRKQFCDTKVIVSGECFEVHRAVVANGCGFFRGLFTTNMKESKEDQHDITGTVANKEAFRILLDYLYSGVLTVSQSSLPSVMVAADAMSMRGAYEICCEFLEEKLERANAISTLQFGNDINCKRLSDAASQIVFSQFVEISRDCDEFLDLDATDLKRILSSDDLHVNSEEEVYSALLKWLQHDIQHRQKYAGDLLSCVRFCLLSPEFLAKRVSRDPVIPDSVRSDSAYLLRLQEALRFQGCSKEEQAMFTSPSAQPRTQRQKSLLWCVGGTDGHQFRDTLLQFDPTTETWTTLANMKKSRCGFGIVHLDGFLYAVGGKSTNEGKSMNHVEKFDIRKGEWTEVAPLTQPRRYHGVAALDGKIYAIGGGIETQTLQSVERYDPETDKWEVVAPLLTPRKCLGVGVLNGKIYAVGGFSVRTLKSVEMYDPVTDQWTEVSRLNTKRQFHGCAVLDGFLYAVGGNGRNQQTRTVETSVERYNAREDMWEDCAKIKIPRSFLGVGAAKGCLYAIGGHSGHMSSGQVLKNVEKYDPRRNEWVLLAELEEARSAPGIVAI